MSDIHILLIDDDEIVHEAMNRVLEDKGLSNPLLTAKNGEQGLEVLRDPEGPVAKGHQLLIILDLNMPKMDGHEFLKELRADPKFKELKVFILTTSHAPDDMGKAYDQEVLGYIVKDELFESLEKALAVLDESWYFE